MKKLIILTMLVFAVPVFGTVSDGETIRESFTTNGSTTTFTFTFKCNSSDDVFVYSPVILTGLPITPLVEDTDYTIAPTGGSYLNGGVVTISPALEDTVALSIVRRIKQSQETSSGAIKPATIVTALDKLTRAIQDAEDRRNRSLHVPESDSIAFDMTIPNAVDRAGKVLNFDGSGNVGVTTGGSTFTVVNGVYESITTDDLIAKGPRIDVRAYGADPTGATSSQTAIQAALDVAVDGDVVWFPPGTYLFDSGFSDIVKDVSIIGDNAVLTASTRIATPVFTWDTRDDFTVSGLIYDGEETYASFSAPLEGADIYGLILLDTCDNVKVSNISGLESRNLIKLDEATNCTIEDIFHIGVLNVTKAGSNYHPAVSVSGGINNKVSNVYAEQGGQCVLAGGATENLIISKCSGTVLHDNGAYISSGFDCQVLGCNFWDMTLGGIKVRGSQHIVSGNRIEGGRDGIIITGNGTDVDSHNANGFGTVCTNNVVTNVIHNGILVDQQDTFFPRDVVIANNTINDLVNTGNFAAIKVALERGVVISGNVINGNPSDSGLVVNGLLTDAGTISGVTIIGNTFVDCDSEGMRLSLITESTIAFNTFKDLGLEAIDLRQVTDSVFIGNSHVEGEVIRDVTAQTNTGNVYAFNYGTVFVDPGPQILNRLFLNYNSTSITMTFGATDATPPVEGGAVFLTGASGALNMTDFDDGDIGQVITILGADGGNTTVKHDIAKINLVGGADWNAADGTSLVLWYDGTDWNEISRAAPTMS